MKEIEIAEVLTRVAREYPPAMVAAQIRDIPRVAFHLGLVLKAVAPKVPRDLVICDIGGGIGLFSVGCGALGFGRVILVDDFADAVNWEIGREILQVHQKYGVEAISRDVIKSGLQDLRIECDAITSFDSMEHWHHSPKKLLHEVIGTLVPGGAFILGVPNCVNLRKRVTVPFGFGKWSSMQDWYEAETFRGHVREPDVNDLYYISRDIGLVNAEILGRNWQGIASPRWIVRFLSRVLDRPLQWAPSLCADLYLVGRKPPH